MQVIARGANEIGVAGQRIAKSILQKFLSFFPSVLPSFFFIN
jgi:hypothetical protein